MPNRALIIAIENYPLSQGSLTKTLEGTLNSAISFRQWLLERKKLNPIHIQFCTDQECEGRTSGATRSEIIKAIAKLVQEGKDNTSELYIYFSGHGFLYKDSPRQRAADILVSADFENASISGDKCLKLEEIQTKLWFAMGPGHHYYFVDACRNLIRANDVDVTGLGCVLSKSVLGVPTIYTIFSTYPGDTAAVSSGFGKHLVEGLSGAGRAKVWDKLNMFVTFDALIRYVQDKLKKQQIDGRKEGIGGGKIMELKPIPKYECEVSVEGAKTDDIFTLSVQNGHLQKIASHEFKGEAFKFSQIPDDYYLQVSHPTASIEPIDPIHADLYDHCRVNFHKRRVFRGIRDLPKDVQPAKLELIGTPNTELIIQNLQTGEFERCEYKFLGEVKPGKYLLNLIEHGISINKKEMTLKPNDTISLDLGRREKSYVKDTLLRAIPESHDDRRVYFSESLGWMANSDLGLWLSIIGASRIVGGPGDFKKLESLPLESFQNVKRGDSPIYVLVGLEDKPQTVQLGISHDDNPQWLYLQPVKNLIGIYEHRVQVNPGSHLLSFKISGKAAITIAVYCLENRATLITLTDADNGELKTHQHLLPIHKLLDCLNQEVRKRLHPKPLQMVKFMSLAQQQFDLNYPIKTSKVNDDWNTLLAGKWFDPIMNIIASYELFRRGQLDNIDKLLISLKQLSPGLPDIQAINKLAEHRSQMPKEVPIFLDGLLAFDNYSKLLPLSEHYLDFHSPWTSWRGAVKIR
ncbi:MAG: caspase family protein [bacterium]